MHTHTDTHAQTQAIRHTYAEILIVLLFHKEYTVCKQMH